ncbi:MAG TPA: SRPBCC family protein [Acidimicrobiia bacterium]|nr:SRPBCC family protein [Acidimicrobiia bacterium]
MPIDTFAHQATTEAAPSAVWAALQRADTWAAIAGVNRVEDTRYDNGGGLAGFRFLVNIAGIDYRGVVSRTSAIIERQMVMSIESSQLKGMIGVELHPTQAGTQVKVTMSMRPNGFLSQMVFPAIAKAVAGGFDEAVVRFVAGLGEPAPG